MDRGATDLQFLSQGWKPSSHLHNPFDYGAVLLSDERSIHAPTVNLYLPPCQPTLSLPHLTLSRQCPLMSEMGNNIRKWRDKRKLSQSALGKHLGVSRAAVSQWESGDHAPATERLIRLAEILQCEVSDLVPEATMNGTKQKSIDAELRELPKEQSSALIEMFRRLIQAMKTKGKLE